VFKRFRRWVKADAFYHIFDALASDADVDYAIIDGTIDKVYRSGQGAKGVSLPGQWAFSRRDNDEDTGSNGRARKSC